jgi:hypothetical protein
VTVVAAGGAATPTHYVDATGGSDSNSGTSPSAAWRTLSKVNAAALQPGNVVGFKRGETFAGTLTVRRSGSASSPITFTSYGTGNVPVIDARDAAFGVQVTSGARYVVVDGLRIQNSHNAGVQFDSGTSHNAIRNSEITDSGAGVYVTGSYHSIVNNDIHDLRMIVNDSTPGNDYGAMGINLTSSDHVEIAYNRLVRCRAPSIDYGYDGGAIELWRSNTSISIHHNYAETTVGFMEAGGTGGDTVADVIVAYNVIVDLYTNLSCFHLGDGYRVGTVTNLRFENNTVVPASSSQDYLIWFDQNPSSSVASYRNNVMVLNPRQQIASYGYSGFTHDHNLFWRTDGSTSSLGLPLGPTEMARNPLFVSFSGRDLALQSGSPARNAGVALGYASDFDGNPVSTSSPSLGAYE